MENKISITVEGANLADVARKMVALGQNLDSVGANEAEAPVETPKKGRGKKAKAEEPEETVEMDEETSVEDLEDDAEETSEDDDTEEMDEDVEDIEDDEPTKIDTKQLAQLKKALNSYSAKNGKPKAVKILHKFAKVSQDVKAEDFAKIMKALKV